VPLLIHGITRGQETRAIALVLHDVHRSGPRCTPTPTSQPDDQPDETQPSHNLEQTQRMPGMNPQHDCRQENQYREAEYHRRGRFGPLSHPRPVADDGSPGDKKREGYRQQNPQRPRPADEDQCDQRDRQQNRSHIEHVGLPGRRLPDLCASVSHSTIPLPGAARYDRLSPALTLRTGEDRAFGRRNECGPGMRHAGIWEARDTSRGLAR